MKTCKANLLKLAVLAGIVGAISCGPARAVPNEIVNRFNTACEVGQWRFDFGSVTHSASFDALTDANNNPSSGSMQVVLGFNSAVQYNNQGAHTTDRWYPGLNGADYSSLSFDLKIDPNSANDFYGNNGYFAMVIRNTDNYNYNTQFGDSVRSADGWRHVSVPLTGATDHIRALTFNLYGGPGQNIDGDVTFWIDNIEFTAVVPEPSTLALVGLGTLGLLAIRLRR